MSIKNTLSNHSSQILKQKNRERVINLHILSGVYHVRFFDSRDNNIVELGKRTFKNRFLLHYALQTFLEKHDTENGHRVWSLHSSNSHSVRIGLQENEYCEISLGRLDDKGEFHEGRWSKTSRAEFIKRAQDTRNKFMYVLNEHEFIPSFEPELQASANEGVAA